MSHRKQRAGYGRQGLFEVIPDDPTGAIRDVPDNPLLRDCKRANGGCGSSAGHRCTRPARGGRVDLKGYHPARRAPEATHSDETPDPRVAAPTTPPSHPQRSTQEP